MAWSTPDISRVTDALSDLLTQALADAVNPPLSIPHFTVKMSLSSPEIARGEAPCQLTLYLMHVGRDPTWRNTPAAGPRPQLNTAQPLSLNLYYLLTAWAGPDYTSEQRAMTIALQAFHTRPVYRLPPTNDEVTITVEADTIEEMSRLWQAFTVPMRLSCVVKVGVVFVTPALLAPKPQPPPVTANLAVGPTPGAGDPPVLYAAMNLAFAPYPPPADPALQTVSGGELVAVGGSNIVLRGAGLDQAAAAQVFLSTADGLTEWRITAAPAWRTGAASPGELALTMPVAYVNPASGAPAPPARTPAPGVYRLSVGRNVPAPKVRSNTVPLTVAARIDSLAAPPTPGAHYTLAGAGFATAPGATTVSLGAIPLAPSGAASPPPGRFHVAAGGASIAFTLPAILPPPGTYPIGVVVNGVPCLPGFTVTL